LNKLTREVTIAEDSASLGAMRLPATNMPQGHQNMYGHDYPPAVPPDNPSYEGPWRPNGSGSGANYRWHAF